MNALHRVGAALLLLSATTCSPHQPTEKPPLAGASIGGAFSLTDQHGRTVTDRSFPGQYRIMYFGYTYCPDVCPNDMANVGAGLRLLESEDPALAKRVVPIFVTVDPARDTPQVLGEFVSHFHPRMIGLTGSPDAIKRAADEYRIFYQRGPATPGGYLVNHSRQTYLMSPDNKPLALLPADASGRAVADEIKRWAT